MSVTVTLLLATLLAMAPSGTVPLSHGGRLHWKATDERCPDAVAVAALVDQHLAPRGALATRVSVDAEIMPTESGRWSIELRIDTGQGSSTRSLHADDCPAAAETVALAVALAVGPAADVETVEVPPAPEPGLEPTTDPTHPPDPSAEPGLGPTPAPTRPSAPASTHRPALEPTPPAERAPPSSADTDPSMPSVSPPLPTSAGTVVAAGSDPANADPHPSSRLSYRLGLGGGITGGHIGRPGAAALARASIVGRRWELSLRADHLVRRRLRLPDRPEAGGVLSFTTGGLHAGPVLRPGPLELPLLAGVTVGAVRARGFGSDRNRVRSVPWATVVVGPELRWIPVPRLAVGVLAELSIALVRHSFTLGSPWALPSTGGVAGRAFATLALRLP